MKLEIVPNKFVEHPYITVTPPDNLVLISSMRYFDKDGYELNGTEQIYYTYNNIDIHENHLYHTANHVSWFRDSEQSDTGCVLDHSTIVTRWEYRDAAYDQILNIAQNRPEFNKLLAIKKKWGIDFSLDYVYWGGAVEVFHIEADYTDYALAVDEKARAEELILNIDWEHGAKKIQEHKYDWFDLNSDDQADWKARYFGWHRAFDNRKVFI